MKKFENSNKFNEKKEKKPSNKTKRLLWRQLLENPWAYNKILIEFFKYKVMNYPIGVITNSYYLMAKNVKIIAKIHGLIPSNTSS